MKNRTRGLLADVGLLYAAAIWGSTFIVVKDSIEHVDPLMLLAYRFTLAAVVLGVVLRLKGHSLLLGWKKGFLLGAVLWSLYAPQTIGLRFTTASNSGFITGLFVAFMPVFYLLFFKRLPSIQRLVAVVISMAGLWLLTGGMQQINLGDLLTVGAAVFYALHIILADRYIKGGDDPYVLSFQQFLTVGLLSFICVLVFGLPMEIRQASAGWAIVFLALFPTLSAFVIQLVAQKIATPLQVSLIFATEPLFAAVFAWTYGGESFIPLRAVGGLLIVAAIVVSELPEKNVDRTMGS